MQELTIQFGTIDDLPAIVDIYNQAIRSKNATGDTQEYEVADRIDWFKKYDQDNYPIYVAQLDNNTVGYCTMSPYRPGRKAMAKIAEISFYLDYDHLGKGIGTQLVEHAFADCSRIGKKHLLAILLDINTKSIGILKKFNFSKWGHYPNVIDLDGHICGQVIYGLNLTEEQLSGKQKK